MITLLILIIGILIIDVVIGGILISAIGGVIGFVSEFGLVALTLLLALKLIKSIIGGKSKPTQKK